MQKIVLLAIGALYFGLGTLCAWQPAATANALGYSLDAMARIEYIVVYGGLEWGLGGAMMLGALNSSLRPGVFFMTLVFSTILPITRFVLILEHGYNMLILMLLVVEIAIVAALLLAFVADRKTVIEKI